MSHHINGRINKTQWVKDMELMHRKYGVHDWMENATYDQKSDFMDFRIKFLQEELDETREAFVAGDLEEIVDGLIDLCVIAIGTLDAYGVDADKAWDEVLRCNLAKEVGVKDSRPNPLGLPDLVKPEGWRGPNHKGNTGTLV